MPIYRLCDDLVFPPVSEAEPEGILAVGGDLSVDRLLRAYASGIFPWFSEGEPIQWWSPDPRFVLFPEKLRVSDSMRRLLRSNTFDVTYDQNFEKVIRRCRSVPRKGQQGTWITGDMLRAYAALHEAGFAHSVELWRDRKLVGGLYGVALGSCFFGESMFAEVSNASKVGFVHLVRRLASHGCSLIDCQIPTAHLKSLGAEPIARSVFTEHLKEALTDPTAKGPWAERH